MPPPFPPTNIFSGFKISLLGNSCQETNEIYSENSRKNVNNKKITQILKFERKKVTPNELNLKVIVIIPTLKT